MWEFIHEVKPLAIVLGLLLLLVWLQDLIKAVLALVCYFGLALFVCQLIAGYLGWDTSERGVILVSGAVAFLFTLLAVVNIGFGGLWSSVTFDRSECDVTGSSSYSFPPSEPIYTPTSRPSWSCPVCGRESCSGHG
ncbi:MAG: hypothetical protein JNL58_27905 [Planctomyces sp.]|nr:hypothetical protein [Planctomyces sp.]